MSPCIISIPVSWSEAHDIAAILKLRARSIQRLADNARISKDAKAVSSHEADAARIDAFADKLLSPFIGEAGIDEVNVAADKY